MGLLELETKGAGGGGGAQGDTGDPGLQGDTGDDGDTGAGIQGDTGADSTVQGDTGDPGDTGVAGGGGAKGDTGTVYIIEKIPAIPELTAVVRKSKPMDIEKLFVQLDEYAAQGEGTDSENIPI